MRFVFSVLSFSTFGKFFTLRSSRRILSLGEKLSSDFSSIRATLTPAQSRR